MPCAGIRARSASIRRAVRSIPIDRSLATTRTPWCRASQREHWAGAGADLEHGHAVAHPEQVELGLGPALRPPDELAVAEEGAVLGVVVVGLAVPPGPVRGPGLVAADRPAGGARRRSSREDRGGRRDGIRAVLPACVRARVG